MAEAPVIESVHAGRTAPPVDITTLLRREPTEEAIADEAKKGYDMLLVGVEPAVAVQGKIDEKVARVSQAFEGPLAIAVARGSHREEPAAATHLNILVPVTGTEYSRRGAEVALALARASLGSVTVLYVARRGRSARRHGMIPSFSTNWRGVGSNEEAILRDAVQLGDRFGVPLRTAVRVHADPEEAILQQLRIGEHNLIIMGVSPRPRTTLFFGDAAAAVLKRSHRSILLVAS
jgi:nucleotide-binding universal stress UspA family protein